VLSEGADHQIVVQEDQGHRLEVPVIGANCISYNAKLAVV